MITEYINEISCCDDNAQYAVINILTHYNQIMSKHKLTQLLEKVDAKWYTIFEGFIGWPFMASICQYSWASHNVHVKEPVDCFLVH